MFEDNTKSEKIKQLKSTLEKNIPDLKRLPYRKPGKLTFDEVQTACSEYFKINPKFGGRSSATYSIPTKPEVSPTAK